MDPRRGIKSRNGTLACGAFSCKPQLDDGILGEIFIPEVRGKKITNICENQLREIRHKVAHGSLDSGDFLLLVFPDNQSRSWRSKRAPRTSANARRIS